LIVDDRCPTPTWQPDAQARPVPEEAEVRREPSPIKTADGAYATDVQERKECDSVLDITILY
jgi:hypothetical protein